MATLADTAMVGSIGASATAAVAVNISSVWLINGFITALSVGCSYLAAHAVGSGSVHRTHSVTYQSITCSLILGLLLFFGVELVCRPLPSGWALPRMWFPWPRAICGSSASA